MKKLLVVCSLVLIAYSGTTRDIPVTWLGTAERKFDCQRINFGLSKARVVLKNGQKLLVPINSIQSYSIEGKEFTKLPVYRNNRPTGQSAFFELVKTRGELSLYRTEMHDIVASDLNTKIYRYYLYKGDKLHLALDEQTLPNVCEAFGLSYSYL